MSSGIRQDNNLFYLAPNVTGVETSPKIDVSGARGFALLVSLTDNGGGAGTVALRASLDGVSWVEITGTNTPVSFTSGLQTIMFNVVNPMYKYVDVDMGLSAGDVDVTGEITVIEGGH